MGLAQHRGGARAAEPSPRVLSHKLSGEEPLVLLGGAALSVSVIGSSAEYL